MIIFQSLLASIGSMLSSDPAIRMLQIVLLIAGIIDLFLLLFTLRDVLLRTRSFVYQALSILIVAALPIFGFFIYLLIRPARTIKERETDSLLRSVVVMLSDECGDCDCGCEDCENCEACDACEGCGECVPEDADDEDDIDEEEDEEAGEEDEDDEDDEDDEEPVQKRKGKKGGDNAAPRTSFTSTRRL